MPLTAKGEKVLGAMQREYGSEKGERVFYASANKGTVTGVHAGGKSYLKKVGERLRQHRGGFQRRR